MKLIGILAGQTVLVVVLDIYFDTCLGLWLLYFLPLLGTARVPGVRVTLVGATIVACLLLAVGVFKICQVSSVEIFIPRALAVYALGLTAVLLIRGKQFGIQAMHAVANAAADPPSAGTDGLLRRDIDFARERLLILSAQLSDARRQEKAEVANKV